MGYRIGDLIFEKIFPLFLPTRLDLQIDGYEMIGVFYIYKNQPYIHFRKKDALEHRKVVPIVSRNFTIETIPIGWYRIHSAVRIFLKIH